MKSPVGRDRGETQPMNQPPSLDYYLFSSRLR
jgi:hypothetical protein